MSEIFADPPDPSCYLLSSGPGIEESQLVDPDPSLYRVRDARGRFAEARRPAQPATRHPQSKRRVPDLAARLLRAEALSGLIDRKPHLLRPLGAQLLSSPLRSGHPVKPAGATQGSGGHCAWRRAPPGAGCSALAVGRTARFLRSFAGRVAEPAARPELETNHGA
jgi:hypothetical protein